MSNIINREIKEIIAYGTSTNPKISLSEDQAFNVLLLQYYCFKESDISKVWYEILSMITDGKDDGGIDAIYFDEEDSKIIILQNKYSNAIQVQDVVNEINKIIATMNDFKEAHTGSYNKKTKRLLQESLDRLTDENEGNVEILFSSLATIDIHKIKSKLLGIEDRVAYITVLNKGNIEEMIEKLQLQHEVVAEDSLYIDNTKNVLKYASDQHKGIFVNVSSESISRLYNKYNQKGLFNLNIRRYIRNKNVDDGIKNTLDNNRDEFWFLNNGLTIACTDFVEDGNKIRLYNFSIVNGGQTTNLIGEYKGKNRDEFYIPCKIVSSVDEVSSQDTMKFFNTIAEATNSQKPIQPKDLKSNSPEMRSLQTLLLKHRVFLEIKRGEKTAKDINIKIKNDELAQLIFSFVNQKPGTSRSNKNSLFNNNKFYKQIFFKRYSSEVEKTEFLLDLIELNDRYNTLQKKFKAELSDQFNLEQANIFNNGKFVLFALFGLSYRIINEDVEISSLKSNSSLIEDDDFIYGPFISNYKEDDIEQKLKDLITFFVNILDEEYTNQYENKKVTSVSNFFKTDKKYINDILKTTVNKLGRTYLYKEFLEYGQIFKRK
ncbi:AIPR family protein [Exiguobacterium sp. s36]|uniref:AIPR family protein n=1 Tax=Exiguobacterium sp. s36 TaxID=2751227 RepID=UPI001BE66B6A|nr:AIPR family protein [Exiguobacterium sp. s36]